jgi:nucleotide-binding universal stress UspA family protein
MKILAAVDGSNYTKKMLAYLAAHDEWLGPQHQYTVLHVVGPVPPRAAAVLDREALKGYYDDEAEKVFRPIRKFFAKQKLEAQYVSKVGPAAEQIVAFCEKEPFDLVVMGSHGHTSFTNLLLGSVATKVIAEGHTPVLIVR